MLTNVRGPDEGDQLVTDLLQRADKEIQQGMMPVQIFGNEVVFREELKRIFARTWMFLGHEPEVPNPGDFVRRRIGLAPCSSCAATTARTGCCRTTAGTEPPRSATWSKAMRRTSRVRTTHRSTRTPGEWQSAPKVTRAYRELDPKACGLFEAPHVDTIHGLIYASLAPDAEPLRDFLGDCVWFLDLIFGLHPDGLRVVGPRTRWRMRCDWKAGLDNFVGDNYHVDTTHYAMDVVEIRPNSKMVDHVYQYDVADGFSFTGHNSADPTVGASCVADATRAGAAGIITDAVPYEFAPNAFDEATAAGIPVVYMDTGYPSEVGNNDPWPDTTAYVSFDGARATALVADWMIVDSTGRRTCSPLASGTRTGRSGR